jgi:hypothetical protein
VSALQNPIVFPEDVDAAVEAAVPLGGTTGQVLEKNSNDDHDTAWTSDLRNIESIGSPEYVQFDTTVNGMAESTGKLHWEPGDGTLALGLPGDKVTVKLGQQEFVRVFNSTGNTITKSQVVKVVGAQGNRVSVKLADVSSSTPSCRSFGLAAENILAGEEGFVITHGTLRGLNLPTSAGWVEGSFLWVDPNVPGGFTQTKPQAPDHSVAIGYLVRAHQAQGSVYVNMENGRELDDLHNVRITGNTLVDGQVISWDDTQGVWVNSQGVGEAVAGLVGQAPETLDTLAELAAALGDDPNFATTVSNAIGLRARTDQGNLFTGAQTFSGNDPNTVPVVARGTVNQVSNLFEVKTTTAGPAFTNRFTITPAGYTTTVNFQADGGIRVGSAVSYTTNRNWVSVGNTSAAPAAATSNGVIVFCEAGVLKLRDGGTANKTVLTEDVVYDPTSNSARVREITLSGGSPVAPSNNAYSLGVDEDGDLAFYTGTEWKKVTLQ